MKAFKKGDDVRITSGKFRGWQGRIFEKEKERGVTYYGIFPEKKVTRKFGVIEPGLIGLGMIINIEQKNLKKVF